MHNYKILLSFQEYAFISNSRNTPLYLSDIDLDLGITMPKALFFERSFITRKALVEIREFKA